MLEPQWELLPHFILRSTGFPFDWLERLAFPDTQAYLDELDGQEQEVAKIRDALIEALRGSREEHSARLRRRCCERASRGQPIVLDAVATATLGPARTGRVASWNTACERRDQLDQLARDTFARELRARRAALRDIVQDERFQEAVWLSSPQMHRHGLEPYLARWDATHRPSAVRRVERQLVAYVQRMCAKNETTSFFGPINYGDFELSAAPERTQNGVTRLHRRHSFIAYWAVAALATALAADPDVQPQLRPTLSPLCQVDVHAGRVHVGDAVTLPLSDAARRLLPVLDGRTTVVELARSTQLSLAEALTELATLTRLLVTINEPRPPVTEMQPLAWLHEWVERLPLDCAARTRWLADLGTLQALQCRFSTAPLDERMSLLDAMEQCFERITGLDPRRKGGELYADRLLVYEECVGGLSPLSLGEPVLAELERQLRPVLDLFAAYACASQTALRAEGVELLARLAPDGALPFLRLAARLRGHNLAPNDLDNPVHAAVREQIERNPDVRELALDPEQLPVPDRAALAREVLLTSPDVLLIADDESALRRGSFQVVVGECHDTVMLWGWPLALHPHGLRVQHAAEDLIRRSRRARGELANVLASKRVKITPFEYPGPTIEVMATSQKPPAERIPVAQVTAAVHGGRPVLSAPDHPELQLYNGELPSAAHSLFGLPRVLPPRFGGGAHTPRITLGKTVIQRESWRLAREDVLPGQYTGASFELFRDWYRARRRLGLPRFLYARVTGERKPVFVDSTNYFLLELLEYLARPGSEMVLTEMLPTPEHLWLRDARGAYCAELRLSAGYALAEDVERA